MSAVRPDPDALLAPVQREEAKANRGKLKVFFGATAGVGKTYAMLEDARALKATGVDVVVGYVEPHGRAETEVLLEGLERLPYRQVAYRGAALRDFDLDAALARKPRTDRKSTRLNSSHRCISYAVFCLKKKTKKKTAKQPSQ